jgi:hypothetical protein
VPMLGAGDVIPCDPSDSGGPDGQMHRASGSRAENGAALEDCGGAAPAHSDGVAARERHDAAGDRGSDGCFAEYGEPRAHGVRSGWPESAQAEAVRRTQTREHDDTAGESVAGTSRRSATTPATARSMIFSLGMAGAS